MNRILSWVRSNQRLIVRVSALIMIILFFCPMCLVSCSGKDVPVSGFGASTKVNAMGSSVDGNPMGFIVLAFAVLLLLCTWWKKTHESNKLSVYSGGLSLAHLIGLFVINSGIRAYVEEEIGFVEIKTTFWFILDILISLLVVVVALCAKLMPGCKNDWTR